MQINELHHLLSAQPNLALPRTLGTSAVKAPAGDRMRRGQTLVVTGFAITVIGIFLYCAVCLTSGMNQDLGTMLFENIVPFAWITLAIMGTGTLVWLIGSIVYLNGALDSAPDEEPKY